MSEDTKQCLICVTGFVLAAAVFIGVLVLTSRFATACVVECIKAKQSARDCKEACR